MPPSRERVARTERRRCHTRGKLKMSIDLGAPRTMTRLLYPRLAQRLTAADLHQIYGPTYK